MSPSTRTIVARAERVLERLERDAATKISRTRVRSVWMGLVALDAVQAGLRAGLDALVHEARACGEDAVHVDDLQELVGKAVGVASRFRLPNADSRARRGMAPRRAMTEVRERVARRRPAGGDTLDRAEEKSTSGSACDPKLRVQQRRRDA